MMSFNDSLQTFPINLFLSDRPAISIFAIYSKYLSRSIRNLK